MFENLERTQLIGIGIILIGLSAPIAEQGPQNPQTVAGWLPAVTGGALIVGGLGLMAYAWIAR